MAKQTHLPVAAIAMQESLFDVSVTAEIPDRAIMADGLDEEVKDEMRRHTEAVFVHAKNAKLSLAYICVHIALCRQAFDRKKTNSTWAEHVERNFLPLGLDARRTQMAVATGLGLIAGKANIDLLGTLSKAAFLALGDSPDVIEKVVEITEARQAVGNNQALTQADVQKIKEFDRLQARAQALDEELARSTRAVLELQSQNEELVRKSKQPVESLVEVLPKGYKTAQEAIDSLRREEKAVKSQLAQLTGELDAMKSKKQSVEGRISKLVQADDVLAQLEGHLTVMKNIYTGALVQKLNDSDPKILRALKNIAAQMHAMADTLEGIA